MEESFSTHISVSLDGDSLYIKRYGDKNLKYHVVFFHDIGEYHARYEDFANFLVTHEIGSIFIDLRGHGLSTGVRGSLESYETLVHDNKYFYEYLKKEMNDKKFFIAGHGIGALIALDFFVTYSDKNIIGLMQVNPLIKTKDEKKFSLDNFLSRIKILDKFKVSHGLNLNNLSRNVEVQRLMTHDPLINKKISIGSIKFINKLIEKSKSNIYYVIKPTFIAIGRENDFLDIDSCELFVMSIDKKVLELKYYNSLGHEVFSEISRFDFFEDCVAWMKFKMN